MSDLWTYTGDSNGTFSALNPDQTSRLYFPLMNESGMRSSVTPELKGDSNGGFDRYLMPPVVTEELHRTHNARYIWVKVDGQPDWNVNGLSADQQLRKWTDQADASEIHARPGLFTLTRHHPRVSLKVTVQITVPSTPDQVELWKVELQNTGDEPLTCTPFFALPLFGRHADNIRDHRQVTTMFQRCFREEAGTRIKPTIVHDESGHQENPVSYFAYFYDENGGLPERIWTRMQDFIGEGGSLNNPKAIALNEAEPAVDQELRDGMEAVGAAAFPKQTLAPGETDSFVAVTGLTDSDNSTTIAAAYRTAALFDQTLTDTLRYWTGLTKQVEFHTGLPAFDEWINWLAFQLKCRQIFGNSYLPDFGYGRGGRGWRDLWQDLLSIFLVDPESAREEIINNLKGIRIDGSNATIIGERPGEFKADRNNIPRTWCDHGAWPLFSLNFYVQQTGDLEVLLKNIPYWKDQFIFRSRQIDKEWQSKQGTWQLNENGKEYESSVFEHVLLQQLSAFYHVGEHNVLLLEGADWNDTLDMARNRGESVCFESFYAGNFAALTHWLEQLQSAGVQSVPLLAETSILLDRTPGQTPVNYSDPKEKQAVLHRYFESVRHHVSGERIEIAIDHLLVDLKAKESHSKTKIRKNEWITTGFGGYFNGHYNDRGEAMHGQYPEGWRMDLTSQVIPLMFDVPDDDQVTQLYQSARDLLGDPESPGLRLCTPYPEVDMDIGRITGFVYGHKEHGSKWMQQNIMFMYGLFKRNFTDYGEQMLQDVFQLSHSGNTAKTFPGIPSYFEPGDRGAYMYLTGSSTWLYLTIVTQVFGVHGREGNLVIHPRIPSWLFDAETNASIRLWFRNQRIEVVFQNPKKLSPSQWTVQQVTLNEQNLTVFDQQEIEVSYADVLSTAPAQLKLVVTLG